MDSFLHKICNQFMSNKVWSNETPFSVKQGENHRNYHKVVLAMFSWPRLCSIFQCGLRVLADICTVSQLLDPPLIDLGPHIKT